MPCSTTLPAVGSVTLLLRRARDGDQSAANELLRLYLPRLLEIARGCRVARNSNVADGSDFVSSACLSFWCALVEGRLHSCDSRDDLWPLLVSVTMRKANHHARQEMAAKRGSGAVLSMSWLSEAACEQATRVSSPDRPSATRKCAQAKLTSPRPLHQAGCETAIDAACDELLGLLSEDLREVAVLRLLGYHTAEIAQVRRCAERTVERKLRLIRLAWRQ